MAWQNVIAREWGTKRSLLAHTAIVAVAVGSLLGSGKARAADAGAQTAVATVGPMPASAPVSLDLFLPSVDPKGAADFVAHVSKLRRQAGRLHGRARLGQEPGHDGAGVLRRSPRDFGERPILDDGRGPRCHVHQLP